MTVKKVLTIFIALSLLTISSVFADDTAPIIAASSESAVLVETPLEEKPVVRRVAENSSTVSPATAITPIVPGGGTKPMANLFAEHFFAPAPQKLDHKITEVRGFSVLKTHSREQNAEYSIVTDFGGEIIRSRYLSGLKDTKAIDDYIKKNLKTANFEGAEIRQLPVPDAKGQATDLYWVGDKSFVTPEAATFDQIRS
jgi:hypothetical protein